MLKYLSFVAVLSFVSAASADDLVIPTVKPDADPFVTSHVKFDHCGALRIADDIDFDDAAKEVASNFATTKASLETLRSAPGDHAYIVMFVGRTCDARKIPWSIGITLDGRVETTGRGFPADVNEFFASVARRVANPKN